MKYRKKPVVVEAMQFTDESKDRVFNWLYGVKRVASFDGEGNPVLKIQTLEDVMTASIEDYIVKEVQGEYYPVKPDIFHETYEKVEEE